MAQSTKALKASEILFREGDPSEGMYVVKKGKLSVFKLKGNAEVELAEIGPGQMIGEMAFFDRKPRSASIKAKIDSEIIELPFKALQAQFDTFPEWLKAIVKTINDHLREANKRIKNLENTDSSQGGSGKGIPAHQANKLCAILWFVASKWGEVQPDGGIVVHSGYLRKFTIQVFQEPTTRMAQLIQILQTQQLAKQEDQGEGKIKITVYNLPFFEGFVEWLNGYLYVAEDKRVTVDVNELKTLKALVHFGKRYQPDAKGMVMISLVELQNDAMREVGYAVNANDFNGLVAKHVVSDKISGKDGLYLKVERAEVERIFPYWTLYYAISGM